MPFDPVSPLPGAIATPGSPDVIEVDPLAPDEVWAKSGLSTFSRSTDGGLTWTYVDTGFDFQMPALDVWRSKDEPSRLVALHSSANSTQTLNTQSTSRDGGATWTVRRVAEVGLAGVEADGIAHGNRRDDIVVSATKRGGLRGWSPKGGRYVDLDPTGVAPARAGLRRAGNPGGHAALRPARQGRAADRPRSGGTDIPVRTMTVTPRR